MADYIYSIILLIIALAAIELRKSYHTIPKSELRYRARQGDVLADKIYRAVSYEESLEVLLWLVIVLCIAGSLIIFNSVAPLWLDFIAVALFLAIAFAWLPRVRPNSFSEKLTTYMTPPVLWALNYLHPLFKKLYKSSGENLHTGLYDNKDLVNLVTAQKNQPGSRIRVDDLELIKKALKLKDKKVIEYSRPWNKVQHVISSEAIGPVLLDELHKSTQLFVPVVEDKQSKKVVGMIDTSRLDISTTGEIKDHMDRHIYYLNEDETLEDALAAVTLTGHPVFIVLDKKKRLYGLITLKDIMSQLISLKTPERDYTIFENENPADMTAAEDIAADSLKTT